jgi:hypothetical protein
MQVLLSDRKHDILQHGLGLVQKLLDKQVSGKAPGNINWLQMTHTYGRPDVTGGFPHMRPDSAAGCMLDR